MPDKKKQQQQQKKKQRNSANIWRFISWKHLAQFILECEVMTLADISTAKISWFRWSVTELRIRENCIIVLPVNNSWVWHAGLLGHTTHYHLSWFLYWAGFPSLWKKKNKKLSTYKHRTLPENKSCNFILKRLLQYIELLQFNGKGERKKFSREGQLANISFK